MNHTYNFVDPDSGAHTQHIERIWRTARANIPRFGCKEENMLGYIAEFMFRLKYSNHCQRLHNFFILLQDFFEDNMSN